MSRTTRDAARRGRYGIDEPVWPVLNAAVGAACLSAAALLRRRPAWALPVALVSTPFVGTAASYLYTTTAGKFAVWQEVLRGLGLRGDETILDMGCGRGAVLLMAARMVPGGRAVGVDLWKTEQQSGNRLEATRRNAELEGVADRVELRTGDMRAMPVADAFADVVLSSLAIHNIRDAAGRREALDEAVRVLKPRGRLVIADIRYAVDDYVAHLVARGMDDVVVTDLGWRFWYGGPWLATRLVAARRPG